MKIAISIPTYKRDKDLERLVASINTSSALADPDTNIKLFIRDTNENNLNTWRDDLFGNKGWHLPGGIIRPNEKIKDRVKTVLKQEVNIASEDAFIYGPIAFSELINDKPGIRSHFNSFVFLIKYKYEFESDFLNKSNSSFRSSRDVPLDLIKNHHRYINLLNLSSDSLLEKFTTVV